MTVALADNSLQQETYSLHETVAAQYLTEPIQKLNTQVPNRLALYHRLPVSI